MIWDRILDGLAAALTSVLSGAMALVPEPPSWVTDGSIAQVIGSVRGAGDWIPLDFALQVAAAVVTAYLSAGAIGLARAVLSHLTGGGGAA